MLLRDPMPVSTAIAVVAIVAIAATADRWEMAVYALSFWHYLVYALAFLYRRISLERFKRDSFLLKAVSLMALASVLWTTVPNLLSSIAVAVGFALNIAAARALGADRTYYGFELEALPPKRITAFPYSVTAHPMLIGNMLAFGGTLLDGAFRQTWWQLGLLHVALNFSIILMEAKAGENSRHGFLCAIAGLALGAALLLAGFADVWPYALASVAVGFVFGTVITRRYA